MHTYSFPRGQINWDCMTAVSEQQEPPIGMFTCSKDFGRFSFIPFNLKKSRLKHVSQLSNDNGFARYSPFLFEAEPLFSLNLTLFQSYVMYKLTNAPVSFSEKMKKKWNKKKDVISPNSS